METQSITPSHKPYFLARLSQGRKPFASRLLRGLLPTPGNVLFTLLVVGALFWAQSAGAFPLPAPAAPMTSTGTIAYQGRLANAAGQPITGQPNMVFRIYATATGGTPLWEESWTGATAVNVSDGLFSVMLGSLSPNLTAVIQGRNDLYLGITVGADAEMSPRVQLGSAPFTVQALTVADNSITTAKIADSNVTSAKIADGDVTTIDLANNAVTTAKIADGNVTSADVADGTIAEVDLASNAVTTAKIADGTVTTAKIADGNVATADVADNAITTAKITDGNVTTADVADNAITSGKIADGNVTTADLADGTIGTTDLANNAVTTAKIADGNVTTGDLADSAVTSAKIALDTWGVLARTQGLIVMPEGNVSDDGNGNVTFSSTLIVMNPMAGTFIRINAGTYHLDGYSYMYVDLPPSVPEYASVNPQIGQWAQGARAFDGRDRFIIAQRMAYGKVWFNCAWAAR